MSNIPNASNRSRLAIGFTHGCDGITGGCAGVINGFSGMPESVADFEDVENREGVELGAEEGITGTQLLILGRRGQSMKPWKPNLCQ